MLVPAAVVAPALAQARTQTFVIQVAADEERGEIGTGVVVGRNGDTLTIATAAHVLAQKGTLQILDVTRRDYYHVLRVDTLPDYDIALIQVRAQPNFSVQPVQAAVPQAGEPISVWGNTGDGFWELATGSVLNTAARIPGVFGSPRITIACQTCSFGDSGAGVFDSQGRLLGILTRAWHKKGGGPVLYIEVEPAALIQQEVISRF